MIQQLNDVARADFGLLYKFSKCLALAALPQSSAVRLASPSSPDFSNEATPRDGGEASNYCDGLTGKHWGAASRSFSFAVMPTYISLNQLCQLKPSDRMIQR